MPKRFLQLDDIQNTNNPEQVAALFQKLGYNAACQLLDIRDLELPERSAQAVKRVYLIANHDGGDLQVFLFQLHHNSAVTKRMREIAKSLCNRPSYFFLLGTKDYKQLMLLSPSKSFDSQMNFKLSINEYLLNVANPSYHDLNRLEQLANLNLDPQKLHIIQHETLRFRNKQKQSDEQDAVRIYLQKIGRIPLLKADEEIELARRATNLEKLEIIREQMQEKLQRNPQHEELANAVGISSSELRERLYSKNKLIEANLRLVVSVAKKYTNRGIDLLDLIQEGNLGLIRAVEKFDYTKGYKLSTYATWWIKQGITRALADQSRTIRLPVHLRETISRIKKTTKQLSQELGRIPNTEEIATRLEMTTEKLRSSVNSALPLISLDTRIGEEEDSTLADLIEFDGETPERYLLKIDEREDLKSLLDNLSPREQNVLLSLYGVIDDREKSLEAVGKIFHLTRERIRQIKNQAFSKLKNHINRKIREAQVITKMAVTVKIVDILSQKKLLLKNNLEGKIMNQNDKSSLEYNENKLNQKKLTEQQLKLTDMRDKKMIISRKELLEELTSIESVFSQLQAQLAKANLDLIEPGIPIPEKLILELSDSRKNFIELCAKVLSLAESVGVSPNFSQIDSLEEIKSLLLVVAQAEEQKIAIAHVRQKAMIVLEQVLAIVHLLESNFQPLLECQEKARELYLSISESQGYDVPPDAQILVDDNHPFSHLLTLIEHGKKLDDEAFTKLEDSVEEFFSKALSVAASREKLSLADHESIVEQITTEIDNKVLPEKTITPTVETASIALSEETTKDSAVAPFLEAISNDNPLPVYAPPETQICPDFQVVETLSVTTPTVTPSPTIETQKDAPELEETEEEIQPQYQLTPNDTKQQNTTSISGDISQEKLFALREQIWQLLGENNLSLAFHLAHCLETKYPDFQPQLPSAIIRGVILGRHVRYDLGLGEIAKILKNDFTNLINNCFVNGESEWNQAISLLLATSALRPALLAPNTHASEIINLLRLGEGFSQLYQYCQIIGQYGNQGRALDITAIKTARSLAVWEADLTALREQVEVWWTQAPRVNMIYGPAKAVWSEWIKSEQLIYSLVFPVRKNDLSKLDIAKNYVKRMSSETQINEEVKRTQREINLIRGNSDAITGKALNQIRQQVREAVDFVHKWIDLQESRMSKVNNYTHRQTQQLEKDLSLLHQAVLEELESFDVKNYSVLVKAGISCCRTAVEDIQTLFDPNAILPSVEPELKYLLNAELLKIPSLPMDFDWQPEFSSQDLFMKEFPNLFAQNYGDWRQAFEVRSNSKDHEATERIIEYLQAIPETSIDIKELQQQRHKLIGTCRAELEIAVKETRKKLEGDVALGLLRETERADYAAEIDSIENAKKITVRFYEKIEQLRVICEAVNANREKNISEVREKLLQNIELNHSAYSRICSVLDKGDVLTANEYIDMVQKGQPIPESEEKRRDAFLEFFKEKYAAIEDVLEPADRNRTKRRELIDDILKRRNIGPLSMQQVPGAQARQASEMLDAWFTAKNNKEAITQENARQILSNLGFNTSEIAIKKLGNYTWVNITAEAIQDKNRCPVPAYGSQTQGRYRILCVWNRPTEEELLNAVGDTYSGSGVLVFHFGRMTEKRRRDLARLCRERRRTFIVIDDILMFYLCGERGARLPVLFECALPFTFLEPYTTTSGFVSPEMFYGRERERDSIIAPMGSCFIYGGRQLGKTVLLRYVERSFHSPNEGKVALWLDLKARGICYDRNIDEIWNLLATEFKRLGVIPASKSSRVKADELLEQIQNWLENDEKRCILLLLDEADRFLETDGKNSTADTKDKGEFIRSARLKGLMDITNRRFKVVFAGLHNVQRTTRVENHPLAHLGEAICIGPLLNNGEMREARALIERPFSSIGYQFEDSDLITRILSQTNYYPSLIQLYCQELLKHVTNPNFVTFDDKRCIPYLITSQQVDDAYNNQDLRKAILDRFMWTLQLDQRYEVIAYSIAFGFLWKIENGIVDGFNLSWIRKEVLTWWYEGFQELSSDEILVLLEEMVGLGVLRMTTKGCFSLRSTNVLLLMGTQEEIEAALDKAREIPLEYEPATFRSAVGTKNDYRRSPLTTQQESNLLFHENGVSIIFGCQGAGIDDLKLYLESLLSKKKDFYYYYLEDISAQVDFTQRLKDIICNRQKDGTVLVFVSTQSPWDNDWVDQAILQVGKLRAKNSFVRVVFIADPQIAWQFISKNTTKFDEVNKLTIFSLKPWHDAALRQWLEDCNFPSDKLAREKISAVTGNWPTLLQSFYQNSKSDLHNWELHLQELKDLLNDSQEARNFALQLGIERQQRKVLRVLAELGEMSDQGKVSIDYLVDFLEDIQPQIVHKILKWADLLSLASPAGNDLWRINTVVGTVLQSSGE